MNIEIRKNGSKEILWTTFNKEDFCDKVGVSHMKISSLQEAKKMDSTIEEDEEFNEKIVDSLLMMDLTYVVGGKNHHSEFFKKHGTFHILNSNDEPLFIINRKRFDIEEIAFDLACNIEESDSDSFITIHETTNPLNIKINQNMER